MAEEELFEGLLATLTTERGKEDLVREEIERREGASVNSVKGTSMGYLVLAEPKPGGGSGAGGSSDYVATHDEQVYWFDNRYRWVMHHTVLAETPARRAEGIKVIKRAFDKYGVDQGTIARWEDGFVDLLDFDTAFELGKSAGPDDWVTFCDPYLRECLRRFQLKLLSKPGGLYNGKIAIVSAYRRLGTDVQEGNRDDYGERDAFDVTKATHWRGLAVDVAIHIPVTVYGNDLKTLDKDLQSVGLERTNKSENNHYALRKAKE
jgi:hypothetical protein